MALKHFLIISPLFDLFKNLDGVLFPIGMIFDDDTVQNDISKTNELLQANYGIVSHIVSTLIKIFEEKNSGCIVGFGSVSAYLGREVNSGYAASKRALESLFESLAVTNIKKNIKIQFYVLGYLESNMTFGRNLILPKGSTNELANIVYKNINKKYIKSTLILHIANHPLLKKLKNKRCKDLNNVLFKGIIISLLFLYS